MTVRVSCALRIAFAVCFTPVVLAQGPAAADQPACTPRGKVYTCSKAGLEQALAAARTVALVSQPANHASDAAMASLAQALGKQVVAGNEAEPADLTLRLTPVEPAGVSVGNATADLAMLNVFVAAPGNPTAKLLWSETYTGDRDMPWASVARAVVRQFKERVGVK